ncbi:hypothetical protein chiPu_0033395, partial [Chiloscyllium punctatum]|nr:hypothetical protein [Chiloscyllium punctatum]
MVAQRGGALFVRRRNLLPEFGEALPDGGLRECRHHRLRQRRHDIGGRALRRPDAVPTGDIETRQSGFIDGRNIVCRCEARRCRHR